jgi:endonuclease YncB( thermonuclease family)
MLLLVLLGISVVQYINTGRVTWLTDSFRWLEYNARGLVNKHGDRFDQAGEVVADMARQLGDAMPNTQPGATTVDPGGNTQISWSAPAYDLSGRVQKVTDGDSLTLVDAKGVKHKIRLFGIDSPEYDQPHYSNAREALSHLVSNKAVGIDVKDRDRYGRTVGVVYIDGRSVNLEMVRAGHAWWYKRYARLNQTLREAEDHARAHQLGLWRDSNPVPPWEWRQQRR